MKIISFAWTTPALLAGVKTVTRRDWKPHYAARFKAGDIVLAYDRNPRFKGKPVAKIQLTQDPYFENTKNAPQNDWFAEGFNWLFENRVLVAGKFEPSLLWTVWKTHGFDKWVVRFRLLEVL